MARTRLTHAYGNAETHAALQMLESLPGDHEVTCGADKGFDCRQFESECRNVRAKAHVARKRVGSAVPARRADQVGYNISQRKRKRIEEVFGWMKTVALLRKVRHRGRKRVEWIFTFAAAAYNLRLLKIGLAGPVLVPELACGADFQQESVWAGGWAAPSRIAHRLASSVQAVSASSFLIRLLVPEPGRAHPARGPGGLANLVPPAADALRVHVSRPDSHLLALPRRSWGPESQATPCTVPAALGAECW